MYFFVVPISFFVEQQVPFSFVPLIPFVISRISFGVCGRFTGAELLSFSLALFIVCIWVLTGHWLLMDGEFFHCHY